MQALRSLKNKFDFYIRGKLDFRLPLPDAEKNHPLTKRMQDEIEEFLRLFDWPIKASSDSFVIADVGTRTFSTAPVFDRLFREKNRNVEVHGIEIDAYRRFTNFRSRADYGHYHASQIPRGFYHPTDFTKWNQECDVIALLHPFVTAEPLLRWGLPLAELKPERIFNHAAQLLLPKKGVLLLSCPNEEEFEIASELASGSGFKLLQKKNWHPQLGSLQTQPRWGALFKL